MRSPHKRWLQLSSLSLFLLHLSACFSPPPENSNEGEGGAASSSGITCRLNSDCELGFRCEEGSCVEQAPEEVCEGAGCACERNNDCSTGFVCDIEQGACVAIACLSDADCALGERCEASLCVVDTEADRDYDGVPDGSADNPRDNCPLTPNPEQGDLDGDGQGDACDEDDDDDGVLDRQDNCPRIANRAQYDANQDGVGNACDEEVNGTTLTGQLVEGRWSLSPLTDARVSLEGRDEVVVVDEEGRFSFPEVFKTSGSYQLRVTRPGYEPLRLSGAAELSQTHWDLGELELEPIMMERRVQVQLEGEDTHSGIDVSVLLNGEVVSAASTNREGFVTLNLFAWAQTLHATQEGFEPSEWSVAWDEAREVHVLSDEGEQRSLGQAPLVLPLIPGQLSGYVNKEGAATQLGALVTLSNGQTAVTGPEGRFLFASVRAGRYDLRVDEEGYVSETRAALMVRAGQATEVSSAALPIQLSRERGGLSGVATRADASPLGGVLVSVIGTERTTFSDLFGHWSISGLPTGSYDLSFSADDFISDERLGAHVTTNTLTPVPSIELQPALNASLTGQLQTLIEGYDWGNATLSLRHLDYPLTRSLAPLNDGRFEALSLQPGLYLLEVRANGHALFSNLYELGAGENSAGVIELTPQVELEAEAVYLSGTINLSGRSDHSGAQIRAFIGQQQQASDVSVSDGSFSLRLSPLDHTLTLSATGYLSQTINAQWSAARERFEAVTNGQSVALSEAVITLEVNPGSLVGVVQLEGQTDHSGVAVSVVGQAQTVLTDATGAFSLTDLAQGGVSLRVSKDGYVAQTISAISVEAGAEVAVSTVAEPISLLRARGSLSGVATKLNDPNPGGVRVSVLGTSLTTFSNPEGGWSISGVPTGSYDVRFEAPNFIAVTVNAVAVNAGADSTVNAQVLNPTLSAVVSGSLSTQLEAFDWGSASVSISGVNYPVSKSVSPLADGTFSADQLQPGLHQLTVSAPGHIPYSSLVELVAGANELGVVALTSQQAVETEGVLLSAKVSLEGRVTHGGVQVRAFFGVQQQTGDLTTEDGSFSVRLAQLNHRLTFTLAGFITREVELVWSSDRARFEAVVEGQSVAFEGFTLALELNDGPNGDLDGDGVINESDNCLDVVNPNQLNSDEDDLGDACDDDDDNDGLVDVTELQLGTSAINPDSDGDGLSDFLEHVTLRSSPLSADTDGDGKGDFAEVGDPTNPLDFDEDGLFDVIESAIRDSDLDGAMDEVDGPGPNGDLDGDGVVNSADNCPSVKSVDLTDTDSDGLGDACDPDDDNDLFEDAQDNCPRDANTEQTDNDADGVGDACDSDDDGDGLPDDVDPYPLFVDFDRDGILDGDGDQAVDNCPGVANADQRDNDSDGLGDACDDDDDNDEVLDVDDNCPLVANTDQLNSEQTPDSLGDACDQDDDNDGVLDAQDNCPFHINSIQADKDFDGLGNECDEDDDGDGILDVDDNCPLVSNAGQQDADGDGVGNACSQDIDGDGIPDGADNCPNLHNENQRNLDGDAHGDACDLDIDGDEFENTVDNCPTIYNDPQLDLDGDLLGDACDLDDDNDGVEDRFDSCPRVVNVGRDDEPLGQEDNVDSACDNCPFDNNQYQLDLDKDGVGDACDEDIDGDGFFNNDDNCPRVINPDQIDTSGDGVGDACKNNITYYLSDHFPVSDTALWKSPTSPVEDIFWVALDGGGLIEHVREADGSWSRVHQHTPTDGLPHRNVKHIAVDNVGNLYAITENGISIRYKESSAWVNQVVTQNVNEICEGNGNIIFWKLANDIDVSKADMAIYVSFSNRVIKIDNGTLTCWKSGSTLQNTTINSIDVSPDGNVVWVGTDLGASKYTELEGWEHYTVLQLGINKVKNVGFIPDGDGFQYILKSKETNSLVVIDNEGIELNSNGISLLDYTEISSGSYGISTNIVFEPISPINSEHINIIPTSNNDVTLEQNNVFYSINDNGELNMLFETTLNEVHYIIQTNDDNYWLATENGLYSSEYDFTFTMQQGLLSNNITHITFDQNGTLWYATETGLGYYRNSTFTHLENVTINEMIVDSNNVLRVSAEEGLFHYDGISLVKTTNPDGSEVCEIMSKGIAVSTNGQVYNNCYISGIKKLGLGGVWDIVDSEHDCIEIHLIPGGHLECLLSANKSVTLFSNNSLKYKDLVSDKIWVKKEFLNSEIWSAFDGGIAQYIGSLEMLEADQIVGAPLVETQTLPCIRDFPNCPFIQWVNIKGGVYQMGEEGSEFAHWVHLDNFQIMKKEINNDQYYACYEAGACRELTNYRGIWVEEYSDYEDFATWVGNNARLSSESEWEFVARNRGEQTIYPWGSEQPSTTDSDVYYKKYCTHSYYSQMISGLSRGCYAYLNDFEDVREQVCILPNGQSKQRVCNLIGGRSEYLSDYHHADSDPKRLPADGSPNTLNSLYRSVRGGSNDYNYIWTTTKRGGRDGRGGTSVSGRLTRPPTMP